LLAQQQREHEKIRKLIATMLESIRVVTEATSKLHRLAGNSEMFAEIARINSMIARCQNDLSSRLPALRDFVEIEQSLIALNRDYTPEAGTDLATLATNYTSAVPFRLNRTDKVFSDMLAATLK